MDDCKINLMNIDLPSNDPKYYKEYETYACILKKKVADQNIKNIGIVAPYGAGKSSLIKTYIDMQCREDKNFKNKVISVSLANYGSIINDVANLSNEVDLKNEQNIEKSILQQLFYKNDNKYTPYSRFKALKDNTKQNLIMTISLIVVIFCISFFSFQFFDNVLKINLDKKWLILILCTISIITLVAIGIFIFNLIKSKSLKSIQIGKLSVEKNETESISIFNKYVDEIIYFFQKNKFNILIIEDLDRFNNLEIFSKLKELNFLLNKNDEIIHKHKKITFIYAVKDSMFKSEEERSKFFEFILPVIPSLTSDNVKDELESTLKNEIGYMPLSSKLVIDISDYISSRRILNNVISDFIIHASLLNISKNDFNMDKLFSLMVLKNILPLEYERLQSQSEKSIIFEILTKGRKELINTIIKDYNSEVESLKEKLARIENEHLRSIDELKYIFHGILCKEHNNIIINNYKLDTFIGLSSINVSYINGYWNTGQKTIDIASLEIKYFNKKNFFSDREKILNELTKGKESIINSINRITNSINLIKNMNFKELYDISFKAGINLDFKENFIKLVLVNGYIDENYMDYLSEHSDEFMTSNDKEIIKSINRRDEINVLQTINSPDKIILSLDESKFEYINIFNYYIINELFNNKDLYSKKFNKFISMLKKDQYKIDNLLEKIINSDIDYQNLIITLCENIPNIWDLIYQNSYISNEKKKIFCF